MKKISRRHVIVTLASTATFLCPAILKAAMRKDKDYLIVELNCPHKGKAIGLTGDPNVPFACTKRGRYHSSEFDSNGLGVAGKSSGDPMIIPKHKLSSSNGKVVLELA